MAQCKWPLSFQLQQPPAETMSEGIRSWSHKLYRGPDDQEVTLFYSRTAADTEEIAQNFLKEKILGFDMEWTFPEVQAPRLQDRVGMIQLACEDKIALFHLGLYEGDTADDFFPVGCTLRKIVESPEIWKTGVQILGDFLRLKTYFHLAPQGAFELSDLHVLITDHDQTRTYAMKIHRLAVLVQTHLGLPLDKNLTVRSSTWTSELSDQQKQYAAADAYSGFMLYHRMNSKRAAMDIVLPLPILAEKYEGIPERRFRKNGPLRVRDKTGRLGTRAEARRYYTYEKKARNASPQASKLSDRFKPRQGLKRPGESLSEVDDALVRPPKKDARQRKFNASNINFPRPRVSGTQDPIARGLGARKPPAVLHTGLSFNMDNLDTKEQAPRETHGKVDENDRSS